MICWHLKKNEATMSNPSTNNRNEKPRAVAVEMLNRVYDDLTEKDMSREEFVNESLDIIGKTKAKPKSNLILPGM
jgi:hypothetical protein